MTYAVEGRSGYEPYVIVSRDVFVPYDERFRGYVGNKIVQLSWMASRGAMYHVLPRHFVVEKKHANGENYKGVVGKKDTLHSISKAFKTATAEMAVGKLPLLSNSTRDLYSQYHSDKIW
jgi:hypothetical protein